MKHKIRIAKKYSKDCSCYQCSIPYPYYSKLEFIHEKTHKNKIDIICELIDKECTEVLVKTQQKQKNILKEVDK